MTIGEKIIELRAKHNMSQGDLAEKLNVSRQSVSKWETNASIPDLDRVIQLSDIFKISIDELVRGSNASYPSEYEVESSEKLIVNTETHKMMSTQKIVGFILLAIGLLCCILALVLGRGLLLPGLYIIFCSIICLLTKRHAALIIGWITFILYAVLGPALTGAHLLAVFYTGLFSGGFSIIGLISLMAWILLVILTFFTVKAMKKKTN
jgi:transcriptional regulator with XRE-family HTH domain